MGHNLYIGEARVILYMEERTARMGVEEAWVDEAPQTTTGETGNRITPGYIMWRKFCREVGLYSVFYAPECPREEQHDWTNPCAVCDSTSLWWMPDGEEWEGLMHNLPGAAVLTELHHTAFLEAREKWLTRPLEERMKLGASMDGRDLVLARIDWLVWWTRWALDNCENPTFAND